MLMNIEAIEIALYEGPLVDNKALRPRFTTYLQDLYSQTNNCLDGESLTQGDQLSYLEVVTPLLNKLAIENLLDDVGILCLVNWSPEIDPDHSSYGPYLIEGWMPQARLYNIADQGLMSLFTALKIVRHLVNDQSTSCLLLMPEQNTFPSPKESKKLTTPKLSGAAALKVNFKPNLESWKITDISITNNQSGFNEDPGFIPFIKKIKQLMKTTEQSLQVELNDIETNCQGRLSLSKEVAK